MFEIFTILTTRPQVLPEKTFQILLRVVTTSLGHSLKKKSSHTCHILGTPTGTLTSYSFSQPLLFTRDVSVCSLILFYISLMLLFVSVSFLFCVHQGLCLDAGPMDKNLMKLVELKLNAQIQAHKHGLPQGSATASCMNSVGFSFPHL